MPRSGVDSGGVVPPAPRRGRSVVAVSSQPSVEGLRLFSADFCPLSSGGHPHVLAGSPVFGVRIPTIVVDFVVVEGVEADQLTLGPGH